MEEPPSLKLEDAIISFNAQVMNLDTVQDLFDASFSYRLVGACGLDSMRVAKGQFGHILIQILNLGTLLHSFYLQNY